MAKGDSRQFGTIGGGMMKLPMMGQSIMGQQPSIAPSYGNWIGREKQLGYGSGNTIAGGPNGGGQLGMQFPNNGGVQPTFDFNELIKKILGQGGMSYIG